MDLVSCFVIIGCLIFRFARGDGAGDWGYRSGNFLSPSQWKIYYKSCGGDRQTGIDIRRSQVEYWDALTPVTIAHVPIDQKLLLKRSDLTIYLTFNNTSNVSFNGVGCFRPLSIHWHWGSVDSQGSEHSIDGEAYAMEGHLVTYNCNLYNNSAEALGAPSGLHVFGMVYKVGQENAVIKRLMPYLKIAKETGSAIVPEIPPESFLPMNTARYYRYEGSLTTPPCTENVIWTLFSEVQTISREQIDLFRSLPYGKPETGFMVDNFRPIASLTASPAYVKRVVYASFKGGHHQLLPSLTVVLSTLVVLALVYCR